jgi:hypothetical protein
VWNIFVLPGKSPAGDRRRYLAKDAASADFRVEMLTGLPTGRLSPTKGPRVSYFPVMPRASSRRSNSSGGRTFFSTQSSRTVLPDLTDSRAIAAAAS